MKDDQRVFSVEIPVNDPQKMKEFTDAMNKMQDELVKYWSGVADELGIGYVDATSICYLRTRSRWTQEKEDYLISLAKEGKPLPNVMSGEF